MEFYFENLPETDSSVSPRGFTAETPPTENCDNSGVELRRCSGKKQAERMEATERKNKIIPQ